MHMALMVPDRPGGGTETCDTGKGMLPAVDVARPNRHAVAGI